MRTLIRFVREAWALVRSRWTMSREEYEASKAALVARYAEEEAEE